MFHASRTLKNGATPQERAVIFEATGNNGAPTVTPNLTVPMVPRGVWQAIDFIGLADVGQYDAHVWWYYDSAKQWVLDADIGTIHVKAVDGVNKTALISLDKSECADGIYIQLDAFAGGAKATVWLQGQQ